MYFPITPVAPNTRIFFGIRVSVAMDSELGLEEK
jgi:hypothetical protein